MPFPPTPKLLLLPPLICFLSNCHHVQKRFYQLLTQWPCIFSMSMGTLSLSIDIFSVFIKPGDFNSVWDYGNRSGPPYIHCLGKRHGLVFLYREHPSSTPSLWMSCNLFIQLYFLTFFFSVYSPHTQRTYPTFWGFFFLLQQFVYHISSIFLNGHHFGRTPCHWRFFSTQYVCNCRNGWPQRCWPAAETSLDVKVQNQPMNILKDFKILFCRETHPGCHHSHCVTAVVLLLFLCSGTIVIMHDLLPYTGWHRGLMYCNVLLDFVFLLNSFLRVTCKGITGVSLCI